jgi:glycine/D-amino acid oxidase-like deaminating enzyme
VPQPGATLRDEPVLRNDARCNVPTTVICTGFTAKQVQEAVPLAGDNCFGGVHYKFGGHANPQRSVQAYAWALQDLGGKIIQHSPVGWSALSSAAAFAAEIKSIFLHPP